MRRGEVFAFHFIPFRTTLYYNNDGALLLTLIFKNLPGSKGHRMNSFPGIVILSSRDFTFWRQSSIRLKIDVSIREEMGQAGGEGV